MKPIKFEDLKDRIQEALQQKLQLSPIPNEYGFSLIEGFMTLPLRSEFGKDIFLGGPNIPIVGIVGNTTGRLYTFALKALLPDIEI